MLGSLHDHHCHQIGDAVLCEAADPVHSILRSTDTLAGIGGDGFAVIAPGAQGEGPRPMTEATRSAVGVREPGAKSPIPSASVGWAVFPENREDFETLMRSADERMLRLKRDGRQLGLDR